MTSFKHNKESSPTWGPKRPKKAQIYSYLSPNLSGSSQVYFWLFLDTVFACRCRRRCRLFHPLPSFISDIPGRRRSRRRLPFFPFIFSYCCRRRRRRRCRFSHSPPTFPNISGRRRLRRRRRLQHQCNIIFFFNIFLLG